MYVSECWGRRDRVKYLFGFDHTFSECQAFKMFARAQAHGKDIILPIYEGIR